MALETAIYTSGLYGITGELAKSRFIYNTASHTRLSLFCTSSIPTEEYTGCNKLCKPGELFTVYYLLDVHVDACTCVVNNWSASLPDHSDEVLVLSYIQNEALKCKTLCACSSIHNALYYREILNKTYNCAPKITRIYNILIWLVS